MDKVNAVLFSSLPGLGSLPIGYSDWSLRFWVLLLVALLLLSALVVSLVARWRDKPGRFSPTADEELSHFRELYERGEITREEFQRLKGVLGGRIRAKMGRLPHPELQPPSTQPPRNDDSSSDEFRPA